MANDSTFVPLSVPDGSILAQIERRMRAAKALSDSAILGTSENPVLRRKAIERIAEFEREAEQLQLER